MCVNLAAPSDAVSTRQQTLAGLYHTMVTQDNLLAYLDNFDWFAATGVVFIAAALLFKKLKISRPITSR